MTAAVRARTKLKNAISGKNGREPFLTSHSDGQKGGRYGWQAIKKPQHFCWGFSSTHSTLIVASVE
jgi:hypothetical protein